MDRHNPGFVLFPVNNDRTGWRPYGLPVILVVPHRRDLSGAGVENSGVFNVRVYIEDVPDEALVAGHDNVGVRYPDRELYAVSIDNFMLAERLVDLSGYGVGDVVEYVSNSGVRGSFEFVGGADFYDLSDVLVDMEDLPVGDYNIVYYCEFFTRVVSFGDVVEFYCIDVSSTSIGLLRSRVRHPGRVLDEFYRLTPPPYLDNAVKSADSTIGLYRPFTDILQDVADEQDLLRSINWVGRVSPEVIPYLSVLLGWDIPYFPKSLDSLRRAVLFRTVEFQNLAGSRRAIRNIFRLFGFEILISNLWWSSDGRRLIRPDGPACEGVSFNSRCQVDVVLSSYSNVSFDVYGVPLLFRPQEKFEFDGFRTSVDGGNLVVDAYLVDDTSVLDGVVDGLKNNPSGCNCLVDDDGFVIPAFDVGGFVGHTRVYISGDDVEFDTVGVAVLDDNVSFDRDNNVLNFVAHAPSGRLFVFCSYMRQDLVVPVHMRNLQSNRFDVQVLNRGLDGFADPVTLDFAIDFIYRIKAFHSLLNLIYQNIDFSEVYAVTDICVGGDIRQRYDTDMGMFQVPPAIIPQIPDDLDGCVLLKPEAIGYKMADIVYRLRMLRNLPDEFEAWKSLADDCGLTKFGQDRIAYSGDDSYDMVSDPVILANESSGDLVTDGDSRRSDGSVFGRFKREFVGDVDSLCELDGSDFCYGGRVKDDLLYQPTLPLSESYISRSCVGMGDGVYWISFGAYDLRVSDNDSFLSRLYNSYGSSALHFSNGGGYDGHFALARPSINISKDTMHLPGCRFIGMGALEDDYVSDVWRARPWDPQYSHSCGHICDDEPSYLNMRKVIVDGNEFLEFDDVAYVAFGNSLVGDIPSLGDHSVSSVDSASVIHKVFMKNASGNPFVVFDQLCDSVHDLIGVDEPVFDSYSGDTDYFDVADGYACVRGYQDCDLGDLGRGGLFDDVLEGLGIIRYSGTCSDVLFLCCSGILVGFGLRLDCGCLKVDGGDIVFLCDEIPDVDGLEVDFCVPVDDSLGVSSNYLDGGISTMFELIGSA